MQRIIASVMIFAVIGIFLSGCSGGGNITGPSDNMPKMKESNAAASHYLWGYWQGIIDTKAQTIEFARLREGNSHLNALVFLEAPQLTNLSVEYLKFKGNHITADIGLRHPFLGLTKFTGFDVCGIFISNGSVSGWNDPKLIMAGEGDTRLLNPDGYSRWWNPSEFPIGTTMFGYKDGLLGAPDSSADYNSTLNGYKYFCDDLTGSTDSLDKVTIEKRGMFSAGQKNIRRYELELGSPGLVFNYAVDASWVFPQGSAPWQAPDDFPPAANRVEAWRISVNEVENTLWNDGTDKGGDLSLAIDVYDWFDANANTIRVESPGNFTMDESATVTGGGDGYSTYQVDITNATPATGSIDLLVSVVSEQGNWQNFITGTNTTSYFTYTAKVSGEAPVKLKIEWVDPVELVTTGMQGDPELDEISPCVAQNSNNKLNAFWFGYSYHLWPLGYSYDSDDKGADSNDGLSWNISTNIFGSGSGGPGFQRNDQAKIAPHQAGSCATLVGVFSGHYMTLIDARYGVGWPYVFAWTPEYTYNIEMMTDSAGYIFGVVDGAGVLNGMKTANPNQGDPASPGTPFIVNTGNDARLSHVRSWGRDANNILWLAYGKTTLDGIYLAYGSDNTNLTWTDNYLVWQDPAYNDVRDPSMHLVNGVIHLSFVRRNISTGQYELCYTYGDITNGFSTPVVIDTSASSIEDAHLQFGNYIGYDILGAAYMKESAIYFSFTYDEGNTWQPPEAVQTLSEPAEDPDMIFINHAGSLTQDFIIIWVQGGGENNDCYTRMGHFAEG